MQSASGWWSEDHNKLLCPPMQPFRTGDRMGWINCSRALEWCCGCSGQTERGSPNVYAILKYLSFSSEFQESLSDVFAPRRRCRPYVRCCTNRVNAVVNNRAYYFIGIAHSPTDGRQRRGCSWITIYKVVEVSWISIVVVLGLWGNEVLN